MKQAWAIILVLISAAVASGQYTLRSDGFFYYNNSPTAYTRTLVTQSGYYFNGCYYPGSSYYQYTAVAAPPVAQQAALPKYSDPDWRTKLLDLAAARDKQEQKLRADAFEQQYFSDAVKLLGLEGNFRLNGYGMMPPYAGGSPYPMQGQPGYGQPGYNVSGHYYHNTAPYGVQASTIYAYNQAASYGQLDLNVLYQQAAQLVNGSQKLTGDASAQFSALVGAAGQNQARVAEHLAKAEVVRQVLLSLQNPAEQKGFKFNVSPAGILQKDSTQVLKSDKLSILKAWGDMAAAKCSQCHSGNRVEAKFDLNNFLSMDYAEKQARVFTRLAKTASEKIRMPRNSDGTAAPPLTDDEFRLFLQVEDIKQ